MSHGRLNGANRNVNVKRKDRVEHAKMRRQAQTVQGPYCFSDVCPCLKPNRGYAQAKNTMVCAEIEWKAFLELKMNYYVH